MEKLIELLNEYHFFNTDCINYVLDKEENRIYLKEEFDWFYHEQRINAERIISKKFWFIKRLVENDKIDREKFWNSETKSSKYSDFELSYDTPREDYTNILLMELAIQDEPIQFLIEILR